MLHPTKLGIKDTEPKMLPKHSFHKGLYQRIKKSAVVHSNTAVSKLLPKIGYTWLVMIYAVTCLCYNSVSTNLSDG